MTEVEKQNCLFLRYKFAEDTGDYRSQHQDIRHQKWTKYVNNSTLTQIEKAICLKEFLNNERNSIERYRRKR